MIVKVIDRANEKSGRVGAEREYDVPVNMTFEEAVEALGGSQAVLELAYSGPAVKKIKKLEVAGKNPDEIAEVMQDWKPGTDPKRAERKSKVEKAATLIAEMTKEQKEALLEELAASLA